MKILHAYGDIAGHCGRSGAESDEHNVQVSCVNSGMLTFVFQYGDIVCLIRACAWCNLTRVPVQDEIVRMNPNVSNLDS